MGLRKREAEDGGRGTSKKRKTNEIIKTTRITRNMQTDGPRQAVFNTVELLEQILLRLPAKTVFGVQRVSRQFRDVVATSVLLQQKLFLRSSGAARARWRLTNNGSDPAQYWTLDRAYFLVCTNDDFIEEGPPNRFEFTPARLNPLLEIDSNAISSKNVAGMLSSARRMFRSAGDGVQFRFTTLLRGPASWKDTFLTEPPCTRASISLNWIVKEVSGWQRAVWVSDRNGVKLGQLIDAALQNGSNYFHTDEPFTTISAGRGTLDEVLKKLEGERAKAFLGQRGHIDLEAMMLPHEWEWQSVK